MRYSADPATRPISGILQRSLLPSQSRPTGDEHRQEKMAQGFLRSIHTRRAPPNWSPRDWSEELRVEMSAATWKAEQDFDPARCSPGTPSSSSESVGRPPMQWRIVTASSIPMRSRLVVAAFLLVGNVLLLPSGAIAGISSGPLIATELYGDDVHISVAPALTAIMGADGNTVNQSGGLINVGDGAFKTANPANGTGPSGQGWTFTWATAATQTAVEATMNGTYFAWVVSADEHHGWRYDFQRPHGPGVHQTIWRP